MPAVAASAPGKIILLGEHAVVYRRPAVAVPVLQVRARAAVQANPRAPSGQILIDAPDIRIKEDLVNLPDDHPLKAAVQQTLDSLGIERPPALTLRITSTIPVAAGLGSGAAVSVAVIRALSAFLGRPLPDERVNDLAYAVEKLHHGTPSGIDNTVITYSHPVYFIKGEPIRTFQVPVPFTLVIADTGIASPTGVAVGDVRHAWQADPVRYEGWFDAIGQLVEQAYRHIQSGKPEQLGQLMDENHNLLEKIGVSCPELNQLVAAARQAGALGAKLSGGGRGGNMIALVSPEQAPAVAEALKAAGAARTLITEVR